LTRDIELANNHDHCYLGEKALPIRKALWSLVLSTLLFVVPAAAEDITFSFALGSAGSVNADLSGVAAGPAVNVSVSDPTTGMTFPLDGSFTSETGAAGAFLVLKSAAIVLVMYDGAGGVSVLIVDADDNPLVAGEMQGRTSFLSLYPAGAGAMLGVFDATYVSPAVLAMFGLGPEFGPDGPVLLTFGNANVVGVDHLEASVGGGTVTTNSVVPKPTALFLAGTGLLVLGLLGLRMKRRRSNHNQR
jgi:hypothetical protein